MCEPCLAKFRGYIAQRKATGNCLRCGLGNKAVAAQLCLRCWFKKMASDCLNARGEANNPTADALEELWRVQQGRCAITGETLVPGSNASLDHILPKSRGGSDDVKNVQWVEFNVNLAKSNLTPTEFVAMCRRVVRYAGATKPVASEQPELFD